MIRFHQDERTAGDFTFHGGRVGVAMRAFPQAPEPWIDLSTGINPCAWPIERAMPTDPRSLPLEADIAGLRASASAFFGLNGIAITPVPGSEIGLRLLAQLYLPRPWHVVAPGYRSHAQALPGAKAIAIEQVEAAAASGGTILFANPANPDGRWLVPDKLLAIGRKLGERGGMLVVDEAFADTDPIGSVAPLLRPDDSILVSRSFGKFFGLAGIRLGFMAGVADIVAGIATLLGSWPVTAQAIGCGTAAYADREWIAAARADLACRATSLDRLLTAKGFDVRGECPLFRLVDDPRAAAMFEGLAHRGILTRPFDYASDWLRFGLPADDAAFDRLEEALRHF